MRYDGSKKRVVVVWEGGRKCVEKKVGFLSSA